MSKKLPNKKTISYDFKDITYTWEDNEIKKSHSGDSFSDSILIETFIDFFLIIFFLFYIVIQFKTARRVFLSIVAIVVLILLSNYLSNPANRFKTYYVASSELKFWSEPEQSQDSIVLHEFNQWDEITVYNKSESDNWVKVKYKNNKKYIDAENDFLIDINKLLNILFSNVKGYTYSNDLISIKVIDLHFYNLNSSGKRIDNSRGKIHSDLLEYLGIEIEYRGLRNSAYNLFIKIVDQNGNIISGSKSPPGYSFQKEGSFNSGYRYERLGGFGNSTGRAYSPGIHLVEIWYNDNLLISKTLNIL